MGEGVKMIGTVKNLTLLFTALRLGAANVEEHTA